MDGYAPPANVARYLLDCSMTHMEDAQRGDVALVLAARAQGEAILATAEAIEELTRTIREKCGRWLE